MKDDLKRSSIQLTPRYNDEDIGKMWMYEEGNGLGVYSDRQGLLVTIPLASIRAYLRRLDRGRQDE